MANHVVTGNYQNGQLFFEMTFLNGIKHGPFIIYHENGQIMMESYWRNGQLDGSTIFRNSHGEIEHSFQFTDGLPIAPI